MSRPTSRSFGEAKRLGDEGEVAVARFLARNAELLRAHLGQSVTRILVKKDRAVFSERSKEVVRGVEIVCEPRDRAEQRDGDLILYAQAGAQRRIEVKSEQYLLDPAALRAEGRVTPNVAVESHDLISPPAYERLWAKGRLNARGYLAYPPQTIGFDEPQRPAWYSSPGGHFKTQADWLIHLYSGSAGDLVGDVPKGSRACLLLSLNRVKDALMRGDYNLRPWFASCTLKRGAPGKGCRLPGNPDIKYYTVGKLLRADELIKTRRAIFFAAEDG